MVHCLAQLDALQSLAALARTQGYCRPEFAGERAGSSSSGQQDQELGGSRVQDMQQDEGAGMPVLEGRGRDLGAICLVYGRDIVL